MGEIMGIYVSNKTIIEGIMHFYCYKHKTLEIQDAVSILRINRFDKLEISE